MPRLLALLILIANLAGCTGFLDLKHDLKTYQDTITHVSGTLAAPDCPSCAILIVALDKQGQPLSYKVFEHPGRFDILVSPRAAKLFVFQDINHDIAFNPGEPYAPHTLATAHPDGTPLTGIDLKLSAASSPPPAGTYPDGNLFALRNRLVAGIDVQLGSVAKLNEARFDPDRASMGMWQPMQFLKAGLSGIYFLEDYSPNKTPVLFVHGINGTPRDFAELVSRIDRNTYQPWLFYYPSGLEIPTIGDALLNMLNELRQERHFQDLHIVAHSMGGLVSRSLLNTCRLESECDFVRTFTSISSPSAAHRRPRAAWNTPPSSCRCGAACHRKAPSSPTSSPPPCPPASNTTSCSASATSPPSPPPAATAPSPSTASCATPHNSRPPPCAATTKTT
jgi:hypothetical protein